MCILRQFECYCDVSADAFDTHVHGESETATLEKESMLTHTHTHAPMANEQLISNCVLASEFGVSGDTNPSFREYVREIDRHHTYEPALSIAPMSCSVIIVYLFTFERIYLMD